MVGSATGAQGLSSAASAYLLQQLTSVSGASATGTSSGTASSVSNSSSVALSAPGQLLSNLQQLQTQDPAKFQQVVTQIASQLQTAAQQTQGPQSTFLSNLATRFQNVANGGSISQLQPPQPHHHHHAHQAYSQGAQTAPQGLAGLAQAGSSPSSSSPNLQQLFSSISNQVSAALAS